MLSKTCKYAINAMIYMATRPDAGEKTGLREIAEAINSPQAFTAKILQNLVKDGLVSSTKGPHGGFCIKRPAAEIFLAEIVACIDGDQLFVGCALGLEKCTEDHPCPVHYKFKAVRDHLTGMLQTTHLGDVSDRVITGLSFLKV
jgi:Rrf2 family transcriptional regulator, iron-sulfur cluster assembly transcription factor